MWVSRCFLVCIWIFLLFSLLNRMCLFLCSCVCFLCSCVCFCGPVFAFVIILTLNTELEDPTLLSYLMLFETLFLKPQLLYLNMWIILISRSAFDAWRLSVYNFLMMLPDLVPYFKWLWYSLLYFWTTKSPRLRACKWYKPPSPIYFSPATVLKPVRNHAPRC